MATSDLKRQFVRAFGSGIWTFANEGMFSTTPNETVAGLYEVRIPRGAVPEIQIAEPNETGQVKGRVKVTGKLAQVRRIGQGHFDCTFGLTAWGSQNATGQTRRLFLKKVAGSRKMEVRAHGSGYWTTSTRLREWNTPTALNVFGVTLPQCCMQTLSEIDNIAGAPSDIQMIDACSDALALVGSFSGLKEALCNMFCTYLGKSGTDITAYAYGAAKTAVENKITMELDARHSATATRFWKEFGRAWGVTIAAR